MPKLVYDFTEGNKDLKDLLGGKGANLAEMTNLGLPVPPGFTITTEACRYYLEHGTVPDGLAAEVTEHLEPLEEKMGRKLGDHADPLLVSVRSGAKFSMPGMMETVLNIGLSDESVHGLAKQAGSERFAWDSYRRLIQMFGKTVLDIEGQRVRAGHRRGQAGQGHQERPRPGRRGPAGPGRDLQGHRARTRPAGTSRRTRASRWTWPSRRSSTPGTPTGRSCTGARSASRPTSAPRSTSWPWSSATSGSDSGTGVAFTRDPGSGQQGVYGDYLQNAQGEDVVAGIRNTVPLQDLEKIDAKSYAQLMDIMATLENHYKDLCDIEFTIERGKLWMLQTRVGKRTAGRRLPDRHPAGRPGPDRPGRGADPGDRQPARAADVPALRGGLGRHEDRQGHQRVAGRGRRQGRVRLGHRGRVGRPGRGRHPGPARDQPRRPARHDRRPGHPHQPRRQDQPRGRGRPRHGQDLRLRRRGARGRRQRQEVHRAGGVTVARGRRHLDRRHLRPGLPRRGPGRRVPGRGVLRGQDRARVRRAGRGRAPADDATRTPSAASACGPTPTTARTRPARSGSAPRASACAGPSTCSSASGASWSSG